MLCANTRSHRVHYLPQSAVHRTSAEIVHCPVRSVRSDVSLREPGRIGRVDGTPAPDKTAHWHLTGEAQKEAIRFLDKQLFTTPLWLTNKELIEKCGINPVNTIGTIQKSILTRLISKNTFDKLLQNETMNGASAYTVVQLANDLKRSVWRELASGKAIDIYRRNLQKNYVDAYIALLNPDAAASSSPYNRQSPAVFSTSDASAIARAHLVKLRGEISGALGHTIGISKAHLQELIAKIDKALKPEK